MSDLRQAIKGYILKCWDDGTQIDKQNIGTAVYLGGSAHFFLYFIYKYFFGLNENIYLRIVVVFLCVSVGVYNKLPEKVRKYWFPFYWHIMLIAALPFMLTFNLFNTNFHEAWLYWDIFMALLLALYVPNWLIYFIDLSLGIGLAFLCYIGLNHGINLQPNFNIGAYLIVFLFSATAGVMFTSANRNAWLSKQAAQHTRDVNLAAGIAHDIRSFVTKLKSLFVITSVTLADKRDADGSIHLTPEEVNNLAEIEKSAYNTARHAHHNIDDILSTIKGKPIDPTTFTYHNSNDIAQIAKTEFGYTNPAYEEKVKLDLKSDFIIKADESLLLSVLYSC